MLLAMLFREFMPIITILTTKALGVPPLSDYLSSPTQSCATHLYQFALSIDGMLDQ